MQTFQDHFSTSAAAYARFRPRYPDALFDFLARRAPARTLAWDCGTGSGQAAIRLAERFDRVVATDASAEQLARAPAHPGVDYRLEHAERVSMPDGSADLVTVAAAVHWFDLEAFYREVRRVLRPRGIVAVWSYQVPSIDDSIDPLMDRYANEILGADWPERTRHVRDRYETLPFPFEPVIAPGFAVEVDWSLDALVGFLRSWSGAIAYAERTGADPVAPILQPLRAAWDDPERTRRVECPLFLRVGRV